MRKVTTLIALAIILAGCAVSAVALAQDQEGQAQVEQGDQVDQGGEGDQAGGGTQDEGGTQGEVLSIPTFTVLPTKEDTYVVKKDLYGLKCLTDVGHKDSCAVIRVAADGNDYPWDTLKCRSGDSSVRTYASLLDSKRPVKIFAAPPAHLTSSNTYIINVRLSRVCLKK